MIAISIFFAVVLLVIIRIYLAKTAHKFNINTHKLLRKIVSFELPFLAISLIYAIITKEYMQGLLMICVAAILITAFITVMIIINDSLSSGNKAETIAKVEEKASIKYESLLKENALLRSELAKIKKPIEGSILAAINEIGENK